MNRGTTNGADEALLPSPRNSFAGPPCFQRCGLKRQDGIDRDSAVVEDALRRGGPSGSLRRRPRGRRLCGFLGGYRYGAGSCRLEVFSAPVRVDGTTACLPIIWEYLGVSA